MPVPAVLFITVNSLSKNVCAHVLGISVPPTCTLKKRGRPKGHELTVIGLAVKKQRKASQLSTKLNLQPLLKLHSSVKERFVNHCVCA